MPKPTHAWNLQPKEAIALQKQLSTQVIYESQFGEVRTIAGIDASYKDGQGIAAVVVLRYPDLAILDYTVATRSVTFPYVPGLLTFREGPVVMDALEQLGTLPDLLIFDGQGIAHQRRLGIAAHIGLLTDMPSIGCAKSRLVGKYEEPDTERGSYSLLDDRGETVGAVVRTRTNVKPLFISIGHRIDLQTSIDYILATGDGYRLPKPTRWAHNVAGGKLPDSL